VILLLPLLLAVGPAQAGPPQLPPAPVETEPLDSQCEQAVPLRAGAAVPPELLALDGTLACGAVAVPTTTVAYFLATEVYAAEATALYALEVTALEAERARLQQELLATQGELALEQQEPPWLQQPRTQRWLGRAEVALVVALVAGGTVALVNAGS